MVLGKAPLSAAVTVHCAHVAQCWVHEPTAHLAYRWKWLLQAGGGQPHTLPNRYIWLSTESNSWSLCWGTLAAQCVACDCIGVHCKPALCPCAALMQSSRQEEMCRPLLLNHTCCSNCLCGLSCSCPSGGLLSQCYWGLAKHSVKESFQINYIQPWYILTYKVALPLLGSV